MGGNELMQTGGLKPSQPLPAIPVRLRELSTERQNEWIDRLFGKLAAMYGRTFADLWAGVKPEEVKAEWCEALQPFSGPQIAWALDTCRRDVEMAPTLPRFLKLCQQAPRPEFERKEEPATPLLAMSADVQAMASKAVEGWKDPKAWAVRMRERYLSGEKLMSVQTQLASEVLGEAWEGGQCRKR